MLNVLVAYPYLREKESDVLRRESERTRFLLDSGAFTAWKAGKPISLDEYCRFIESLPVRPWRYFTLDVVGNPTESLKNYEIMRARGFTPVPIFTRGAPVSMLDEFYKTSDVVGIGGLVGTEGNLGFVKGIMRLVGSRKVHWLGFVRHNFINHYRPYMADASSWSHASRNGDLKVYMGKGVIKSFRKKDMIARPSREVLELFATYGVSPRELQTEANWKSHHWLNALAARMWVRRSLETERAIGTKLFLAGASATDLELMYAGYRKETAA